MEENIVINIENLSKIYLIYNNKKDRLREALSFSKKNYHVDFKALSGINLQIRKGETLGIIGQNGSGKSTLLKILAGVITPTSGKAEVKGKVSAMLELGAGFNPEMTGMQNIYLNGAIMGFSREEMKERVPKILAFAEIGDFIDQPVKTYSSGMFARLAFAVAVNVEPEILIVDEALSVGDVFFQNKCFRKFEELRKKGITVLLVSHDLSSVRQMCSRVLWIENGEQRMFGGTNEVCTAYFNEQTKKTSIFNNQYAETLCTEKTERAKNREINLIVPAIKIHNDNIYSENVEIISSYVTDNKNDITTKLNINEEYGINLVIKTKKDLENVIAGFLIENQKGLHIMGSNTYAKEKKTFDIKAGEILKISFKFKLPDIYSGHYIISAALATGTQENHVTHTWLHGAVEIEVVKDRYNLALINPEYQIEMDYINELDIR